MTRTFIGELRQSIGQEVSVSAMVVARRNQGKMVFFELRDMTGVVQAVVLPKSDAHVTADDASLQSAVRVKGIVNARPERNAQQGKQNGDIELVVSAIDVLSKAQPMPFDIDAELNLETHLDHLPLTLRTERSRDIFTIQSSILYAYREALRRERFTEFVAPALVGGDAEGGAAVFRVEYFNDSVAFLATSPQFYKQIMVGPFERAFTVAKIFRAEKSATTRHLSEATCIDFEMGFIEDENDVMNMLESVIIATTNAVVAKHADMFARFDTVAPLIPKSFPRLTLAETHDILGVPHEPDMSPEHERDICAWAAQEKGSDFVFITRFPTSKRAFYTYEDKNEAPFSRGFDLLFRGLEINSGAQRIHLYDELVTRMASRGLDSNKFGFYLQAFKYGLPPHGGCSTGLERFTARLLQLPNVKEATSFPRDMTRIDTRLSE